MKALIFVVTMLLTLPAAAQSWNMDSINLETLTAGERRAYLTRMADSVVMRFGPGYYRKVKPHVIRRIVVGESTDSISSSKMRREYKGRAYYAVYYPYDTSYEVFNWGYAARVYIWADNGEAYSVMFGHGWGYVGISDPKIYNDKRYVVTYERVPPRQLHRVIRRVSKEDLEKARDEDR